MVPLGDLACYHFAMALEQFRIVLVRPRGAANVGAVARAMKNMGLGDLALVRPAVLEPFWAEAMAVHAKDVLEKRRVFDSLVDAVADCSLVVGTTCRSGPYRSTATTVREAAADIVAASGQGRVAVVFGPEDHGLSNDDLKTCQRLLTIPTDDAYPSLNLAQAVMVCCYELFMADPATEVPVLPATAEPATAERRHLMFERLQAAFLKIGFLHPQNPDHIMHAVRRMLGQATMDDRDVRIWLALARQIEWYANRHSGSDPQERERAASRAVGRVR